MNRKIFGLFGGLMAATTGFWKRNRSQQPAAAPIFIEPDTPHKWKPKGDRLRRAKHARSYPELSRRSRRYNLRRKAAGKKKAGAR